MGGTEPIPSTRRKSRTQGQRAKSAAADNACGEIEARLTKSAGDGRKSPILVHTSMGTFAVIELLASDDSSRVIRGRSCASEMVVRNSTPLAWHPNLDKASIPGVEIFLAKKEGRNCNAGVWANDVPSASLST